MRVKTPVLMMLLALLGMLGLGCKDASLGPSGLTYATNPATYTVGVAITANSPNSSGGSIDSYAVSPALPAGLSMATSSGIITGTPTAASSATTYTVTATNANGNTTVSLSITVNASQTIAQQPSSQSLPLGAAATFTVELTQPGTHSYQWLKDGVPIPGATASSYTTPVLSPSDSGSLFTVQVSDPLGRTLTSQAATLTVVAPGSGS
jgi:hypothetical protein